MRVILICLFLATNCFANMYEARTQALRDANKSLKEAIANMDMQRQSEKVASAYIGIIGLSIGVWGLNQRSAYGNVTGVMFSVGGVINIIESWR